MYQAQSTFKSLQWFWCIKFEHSSQHLQYMSVLHQTEALFTIVPIFSPDTDIQKLSARYYHNIVSMVSVTLSGRMSCRTHLAQYSIFQYKIISGLIFLNIGVGQNIGTCEQGLSCAPTLSQWAVAPCHSPTFVVLCP